eukprot:5490625-Pleurochrysis_carterae.AAC.1
MRSKATASKDEIKSDRLRNRSIARARAESRKRYTGDSDVDSKLKQLARDNVCEREYESLIRRKAKRSRGKVGIERTRENFSGIESELGRESESERERGKARRRHHKRGTGKEATEVGHNGKPRGKQVGGTRMAFCVSACARARIHMCVRSCACSRHCVRASTWARPGRGCARASHLPESAGARSL